MCTAVVYKTYDNYFGRNLDLEYSYNEEIVITPRNYSFSFAKKHLAMIGVAYVKNDYPLYYDATNEKGLSMAALAFDGNAHYFNEDKKKTNIAPFEFIPYVLTRCETIADVKNLLKNVNITDEVFSIDLQNTPLHWIIADKNSSITVESMKDGLKIYDNLVGVLTNNPTFDIQMFNLNNYMYLSANEPVNTFIDGLKPYSRGMGAMGLPGDLSSQSRFVKAVFTKRNAVSDSREEKSVSQFFHILSSVEQQRGCVKVGKGYEISVYSSCCNVDKGVYYYKTYDNWQISAVNMNNENLNDKHLIVYPMLKDNNVKWQN